LHLLKEKIEFFARLSRAGQQNLKLLDVAVEPGEFLADIAALG